MTAEGRGGATDRGTTWSALRVVPPTGCGPLAVSRLVLAGDGRTVYAGTPASGALRSDDEGSTWRSLGGAGLRAGDLAGARPVRPRSPLSRDAARSPPVGGRRSDVASGDARGRRFRVRVVHRRRGRSPRIWHRLRHSGRLSRRAALQERGRRLHVGTRRSEPLHRAAGSRREPGRPERPLPVDRGGPHAQRAPRPAGHGRRGRPIRHRPLPEPRRRRHGFLRGDPGTRSAIDTDPVRALRST